MMIGEYKNSKHGKISPSTINTILRYAHLAPDFMASKIEVLDFDIEPSLDRPSEEDCA